MPTSRATPKKTAPKKGAPRRGTARAKPAAVKRGKRGAPPSPAARPGARARGKGAAAAPRARAEQPLGVGVADAYALERLRGPPTPRADTRGGVREIGWAEFGALARDLASRIRESYTPDVVLAIANAGVYVAGAVAPVFGADVVHLHLPGRGRAERLPRLTGKKVLVVDDAANSGRTLGDAVAAARAARAAEVRSAVLVLRGGGARADWSAIETTDVVVFGWDYQFHGAGPDGDPGDTGV